MKVKFCKRCITY